MVDCFQAVLFDPVNTSDHTIGPDSAPVTIVEYGDYECPSCENAQKVLEQLHQRLGDRLRRVFRHFPVSSVHPHASAAAEAAEAAAEQGKFWEMHDELFRRQKQLGEIDYTHVALALNLEVYKFESSLSRESNRRLIRAQFEGGKKSGVTGTPTFFINGRIYKGPIGVEEFVAAANAVLKKSE